MATETQAGSQNLVTEIRSGVETEGSADRSYRVPVGSEIRVILEATAGIGPHNYEVQANGSVESVKQASVREFVRGRSKSGIGRTDIILNAKSVGDGTAKIRTLDDSGVEHGVAFYSFEVGPADDL